MFVNWRTKNVVRFAIAPCIKVEPIIMYPWERKILRADEAGVYEWMSLREVGELAERDGFADLLAFFDFFKQYRDEMLDDFEIIWWDPRRVEVIPGVKMWSASNLRKVYIFSGTTWGKTRCLVGRKFEDVYADRITRFSFEVPHLDIYDGPPEDLSDEEFKTAWEARRMR